MRTFCNWVRTGKPLNHSQPYATPIDPLPDVIAKRSHLAPSVGTGCATDEHRDAQQDWLAHIAAGRIGIGQEFAQNRARQCEHWEHSRRHGARRAIFLAR